ncbi:MAG TPA: tetratricopeptide repeat protein [Opitutus sp.]|nr:tetratricopeptide repeat protein [Opitutus sp.]
MKVLFPVLAAALLLAAACSKPKPKVITPLQRKEAANLVSEANFAVTLRDYARAQPLLEKAVALCPDDAESWVNLGIVRRRQGNAAGAKDAYQSALAAYREAAEQNPAEPERRMHEIYALALLGRVDEARAVLEKARKKNPENRPLRQFAETKQIERLLDDPRFKEVAFK